MNEQQMKAQFQEWLPWHVNGTLEAERRAWVDQYLKDHPEARAQLRWYESLQQRIQDSAPVVSADIGLHKLMSRVRQERRAKAPSLMERINEFFAGLRPTPAFALAASLILVQAGVIGVLLVQQHKADLAAPDYGGMRAIPDGQAQLVPVLQINFKPESTEREIRMLLVSVGGTVVSGPGQLGNYVVSVAPEKIDQARAQLQQSKIVEAVSVLQNPPTKP
jgi:hypothetical protein